MTVEELKSLLSKFHIHPDKRLGQNFLLSEKALDEIVAAAELNFQDTVLEIGPGLGALTRRLGEQAGLVLAVEKDRNICFALRKIFKNKKNVKIINNDALFLDLPVILRYSEGSRRDSSSTTGVVTQNDKELSDDRKLDYKVVANIPYYITGKLLQNFLSPLPNPPPQGEGTKKEFLPLEGGGKVGVRLSLMVLLLQKEVAERITAKPGGMSILSVSVQFYSDPEIISYVSKDEFYPRPAVDSAVVRLKLLPKPRFNLEERKFFQLVKIGFAGKRKQLQNNLSNFPSLRGGFATKQSPGIATASTPRDDKPIDYKKLLSSLNINPLARAQDLSLADWYQLYHILSSPPQSSF